MTDIAGNEIGILVFTFFHNDFIENPVFGIRKININRLTIDIQAALMESIDDVIHDILSKMKLRP